MELIHSLLLQAIEGESGAEKQYMENCRKALEEGYTGVASLFSALSKAEAIHITNHTRALHKNGYTLAIPTFESSPQLHSTVANLENAIRAEYEEFKQMYPSFKRQIQKKYGNQFEAKIALLSIKWAHESEVNHHKLLTAAHKAVSSESDVKGGDYYLCSVCGNIHFDVQFPTDPCEVCGHDKSFYSMIRVEQ